MRAARREARRTAGAGYSEESRAEGTLSLGEGLATGLLGGGGGAGGI